MNASIKSRLDKLSKAAGGNETVIWVNILNEDGTIGECDKRKEGCPVLPCPIPNSCWFKKKYPNMQTIIIREEHRDEYKTFFE